MSLDLAQVPTFDQIPALPIAWWWKDWFAFGWVHEIVGNGAIGKGRSLTDCLARFTRGWAPPLAGEDGVVVNAPGFAIVVLPEDDENERVRPALDAAGADVERVVFLTYLPDGTPFMLPDHADELESAVDQLRRRGPRDENGEWTVLPEDAPDNPVLVYLDPLFAVADKITTNRNARMTLGPVIRMARRTGALVWIVNHFTKDGKTTAGSAAVNQVLRVVHTIKMLDPKADPRIGYNPRVLTLEKGNDTTGAQILFTLASESEDEQPKVVWSAGEDATEQDAKQEWHAEKAQPAKPATASSTAKKPGDWRKRRNNGKPATAKQNAVYVATSATQHPVDGMPPTVTPLGVFPSEQAAKDAAEHASGKGLSWTPFGDPGKRVELARDGATSYAVAPRAVAA